MYTVINFSLKQSADNEDKAPETPNASDIKQLREQLEQQSHQTRQAIAQLMLVREQLISETNARIEAQVFFSFYYCYQNNYENERPLFEKGIVLFHTFFHNYYIRP